MQNLTFVVQDTPARATEAQDRPRTAGPWERTSENRWNSFDHGDTTTARRFADAAGTLLLSAARGKSPEDAMSLARGARAVLATSGRESSLVLEPTRLVGAAAEIARQADEIGQQLSDWVEQFLASALQRDPAGDFPHQVALRSHCEGHVWTPSVVGVLTGADGGPVDMQVYNEWLHQLVLLRDSLLPFVNWTDVPLRVGPAGLRDVEPVRARFLTELLTRKLSHRALVDLASQAVTGRTGEPGYGVLTDHGAALPAVVGHGVTDGPRWLLRWDHDLRLAPGAAARTVVCADEDYLAVPHVAAEGLAPAPDGMAAGGQPPLATTLLAALGPDTSTMTISLEVTAADDSALVDLGQAARGHRYAYRAGDTAASGDDGPPPDAVALDPWAVVSATGLVQATTGLYQVTAGADPGLALALLGKLHPENVVLRNGEAWSAVLNSGKAGPARVVLDVGSPPTSR